MFSVVPLLQPGTRYTCLMPTTLAAWLHDLDPFAIGFVRWYGLSYLVGFVLGYVLIRRVTRVGVSTLKPERVGDFVVCIAVGVIVGGRLGYCLLYQPDLFITWDSKSFPWWGVFMLNRGGMASHGGILGTLVATLYYAIRHGHGKLFMLDLLAFPAALGLFFGRLANFVNGELYGRETADPDFPLAVKFPQEIYAWASDDPRWAELNRSLRDAGLYEWTNVNSDKIVEAIQTGHVQLAEAITPLLIARHPSQVYQAMMEGLALFLILLWIWRKPRKPGVIAFTFALGYGVFRIIGEHWRLPDTEIGFQALSLTRGQWLSVPLVIVGVVGLVCVSLRQAKPVGGWLARQKTGNAGKQGVQESQDNSTP